MHNTDEAWIACPEAFAAGNESWGKNKKNVKKLAKSLDIKVSKNLVFAAGSMFWARSEIAKVLQEFHIEEQEFEVNKNRLDGAIPHAVERLYGTLTIHHRKKLWLY